MSRERSSSPRIPRATDTARARLARAPRGTRAVPTEAQPHDPSLEGERSRRRDAGSLALDGADDESGERELAIPRHLRERSDARGRERSGAVDATRSGRQVQLARSSHRRRARCRVSPGASHRLASRDQSQTHAANVLSGSFERASRCAQPHDQMCASLSSRATWRTASACHFATSNQRERGCSPSRPPRARPGLEPDHDPDPRRRDAERKKLRRRTAR